ncbi:MAG: AraD [Dehalococcoidia bacterium]|nr:AraD [Dehalococcoidia bacterium]
MFLSQFQAVGYDLVVRGLTSYSGNMSIRVGDHLIITRRGCMLSRLTDMDLIETGIDRNDRATPSASPEIAFHRAIYRATQAQAIVHAHPPTAVALSFIEDTIVPIDTEGKLSLGRVPVIGKDGNPDLKALVEEASESFCGHNSVIVRGHGSFAAGQLLEEAYQWTTTLEESCRVLWMLKMLTLGEKEKVANLFLSQGV